MIKVGLAIGIGVITLFAVCFLWWAVWKLRHCMRAKQIFATLEEILVENRKGLKKDVVRAFPTVKVCDLNVTDSSSKLQCSICWLAFCDGEVMRKLPHCGHVFHRHCIDRVLEQQIICPVCGTVLTDSLKRAATDCCPKSDGSTPAWVLVNRPVPLPQSAQPESGSSSSDRFEIELMRNLGEAPLLKHHNSSHDTNDWKEEQKCIDISFTFGPGTDIPVEARQTTSTAAKDMDSFSFSTLQEMASEAAAASNFRWQLRRSRGRESTSFNTESNSSTRFTSRSTSRSSRVTSSSSDSSFQKWESAHPEHLPTLTASPEYSSFDVLPIFTDYGSNRNTM